MVHVYQVRENLESGKVLIKAVSSRYPKSMVSLAVYLYSPSTGPTRTQDENSLPVRSFSDAALCYG